MAKKVISKTRRDRYREILESDELKLEDCRVLAFEFRDDGGPAMFHYELMMPGQPKCYLFDKINNTAQVVVADDDAIEKRCIGLAEKHNGKKVKPIMI